MSRLCEDLAVSDPAGPGLRPDGLNPLRDEGIGEDDIQLYFGLLFFSQCLLSAGLRIPEIGICGNRHFILIKAFEFHFLRYP